MRFDRILALTLTAATLLALMPVSAHSDEADPGTVDLGAAAEPEDEAQPAEPEDAAEPAKPARRAGVGSQIFDVLVLRPLGALATLGGAVFFAISVPLVAPSKNVDVTRDIFLLGPFDYTFERPLGEF